MKPLLRIAALSVLSLLVGLAGPARGAKPEALRDGQHDFDFNIGTWKTHIQRLDHPLTKSSTWIEWNGTVVVRKVWDGRANLEELQVDGPGAHIEGLTLRLYNPQSHQWNLTWASSGEGVVNQPLTGEFTNGRAEFIDQEPYKGRAILVRQVYSDITPNSHHFEQSFSDDGGKTWEPNWRATLTRTAEASPAPTPSSQPAAVAPGDGQHDFDFNIGTWKTQVSRLQHPLTGSTTCVKYEGTHVVRKVWNGRANLGEIKLDGPAGHIEGLSLRLYNPEAHQWSLTFANPGSGTLSTPLVGGFSNGRGEFVDQEPFNGRAILVRTVWSDITPTSCRSEQSFSDDGGKTWEVNWIAIDTRVSDEPATH